MQFIDEVTIEVIAGKGGDGCTSFLRERNRPKGGPNGGNGGRGGDVVLQVQAGLNTLIDYRYKRIFRAARGRKGEGSQKTGAGGDSLYLSLPPGTKVCDANNGELIGELLTTDEQFCIAKGGEPGVGNMHFASSTNRTPYHHTTGKQGEHRHLRLELQLLADIGLVGKPNAGKSSLIRKLSAATPKVADYPFTTLEPRLGLLRRHGRELVVADIPGLIAGSAQGKGLGNRFLRHVARTSLLWHVIDAALLEGNPLADYRMLRSELEASSLSELKTRPAWVILNKCDLLDTPACDKLVSSFRKVIGQDTPLYLVSALSGEGCEALGEAALQWVEAARRKPPSTSDNQAPDEPATAACATEGRVTNSGQPDGSATSSGQPDGQVP